jgi:hypothetical protein
MPGAHDRLSLPAIGAAPVDLEAVGSDLVVNGLQEASVDRAFLEPGEAAARLADQVVMMVFGQPYLRTAATDLLHALVLGHRKRPYYRKPLRLAALYPASRNLLAIIAEAH